MFSQGPAEKRGVGAMQAEDEDRLLRSIRAIVKEETETITDTIVKRFAEVETRQDRLEERIEKLEQKMGRAPGSAGGNSQGFQPEFVEIKGFSTWQDRLNKGATRQDAGELMTMLMPLLPHDLHQHIKPFELRGLRNYSIKIPVACEVIREVKGIWSDAMKAKQVSGPDQSELYVTFQKSPEQRTKYAAMGKLYEFLSDYQKDKTFKAFWAPDFCVYLEPPDSRPVVIASVSSDNTVKWELACQEFLGASEAEMPALFASHRRK